ncbi:hypothetical protein [Paraburkholderia sp. RL17-373-BIF-A]|uniref:hypothetical protein n=1 Tax=Paraburkholderia sp. RL17-373-BIF-A TaxID=3031629 RepID=UPI0038B8C9E4
MSVTGSTIHRALSSDSAGCIDRAGNYGNPGGLKDLILSMLTFGIYAIVKTSKMEQKREAIEEVVRDLTAKLTMASTTGASSIATKVEGKDLLIEEKTGKSPYLDVYYGGKLCSRLPGNFADLNGRLSKEVDFLDGNKGATYF